MTCPTCRADLTQGPHENGCDQGTKKERFMDPTEKLAEAALAIGRLAKDKKNEHGRYDYLSEEAVKAAANRELTSRGIVPSSVGFEILSAERVEGKQGTANLLTVRCTLVVCGCSWQGLGSGIDYGDKAVMKAQTAALREAWKAGLIIATGNDPEGDRVGDEGPPRNEHRQEPEQRAERGEPRNEPKARITYTKLQNGEFGARIEGYPVAPEADDIIEVETKNGEAHQKRVVAILSEKNGVYVVRVARVD